MAKIDVAILPRTLETISVNPNTDNLSILGGITTNRTSWNNCIFIYKRLSPFGNNK